MKIRKSLGALLLTLGLPMALLVGSALTSSPASASVYGPPSVCYAAEGGCFLQNLVTGGNGNLLIYGNTHNQPLYTDSYAEDGYTYVAKDGSWGWMQSNANGECWNQAHGAVYLDSCQTADPNEYFDFVECPGASNYWCIHNYAEGNTLNLAGDSDFGNLYFTSGVNHTSEWSAF